MRLLLSVIFLAFHLCCLATDFDVVVVGSSPISLLEALYRHYSGNRVLIVEEAKECGGSWKSITACGIPHADMGCHTLGHNQKIMNFLEEFVGCKMVSMDKPEMPFDRIYSPSGFYFSKGCHELIENLLWMIQQTNIVLLVDHSLQSVHIAPNEAIAIVKVKDKEFTTSKIVVTPYSRINFQNASSTPIDRKSKYFHLYILIEDPTPPYFSYHHGVGAGISRIMNLSNFLGMRGTGMQLIVFQTHKEESIKIAPQFLEALKKSRLVHDSARLLNAEVYVYEQGIYNGNQVKSLKNGNVIEMLNTSSFEGMGMYIPKWQKILPRWKDY